MAEISIEDMFGSEFPGGFLGQNWGLKWASIAEIDSFGVGLRIVTGHLVSRDKNYILPQLLIPKALTVIS